MTCSRAARLSRWALVWAEALILSLALALALALALSPRPKP